MRRLLDRFYAACLVIAACALFLICALISVEVGARLLDMALKVAGQPIVGFIVPSLPDIAGYLMATSTFLALAATLKTGAHIRVTLILGMLPEGIRRIAEMFAFAFAGSFAAYCAWSLGRLAYDSYLFTEVSPGIIAVPLALPQAFMTLGLVALTVAFLDEFVLIAREGRPSFRRAEEAISLGKEG